MRASFPLVLSVTEPPNHLSYPSPAAGTVGRPLAPLVPTVAGTVEHYAVTPALPPGVALDSNERRHRGYAQRREHAGPLYDHGEQSAR